ncbi:hypothetical protein PR048_012838 [Dryococelus australis]|uniref:DUF4371 domain-containing protein n=1 Tax=Dryococelus australis TaxID=614101 RepID=A0ABQ9HRC0_9NEOP|nr:hypothetical protein PR048_012838 [Dryococelus australis]
MKGHNNTGGGGGGEEYAVAPTKISRRGHQTCIFRCKTSGYYSIIADETDHISGHVQASMNMSVKKHFLGLYETASLTGEMISDLVRDALCHFNLSLGNLKGCYDGGSNVSGLNKAVQKKNARFANSCHIHPL